MTATDSQLACSGGVGRLTSLTPSNAGLDAQPKGALVTRIAGVHSIGLKERAAKRQ